MRSLVLCLTCLLSFSAMADESAIRLEFVSAITLPKDLVVDGQKVGGLSGLAYDAAANVYYAIDDDYSNARFHTLTIDLADGKLDDGDIKVLSSVLIRDIDGQPFAPNSVDPEGIIVLPGGELLVASEPFGASFPAFIRRFDKDGRFLAALPLDALRYDPRFNPKRGAMSSGGFESLTLSGDGKTLYAGFEKPLKQDTASYDPKNPSTARILQLDPTTGEKTGEFVYEVGAMTLQPAPGETSYGRGLNDLLWIGNGRFIAVEREYAGAKTAGEGSRPVFLYEVRLDGATDVSKVDALTGTEKPMQKLPLLSLDTFVAANKVPRVGSYELAAFGPTLPDGSRSLILIEDNDYERPTQAILFAIKGLD